MELHELEVGDGGARAVGQRDALAERAGRIRRPLPRARQLRRSRAASRAPTIARRSVTTPTQRPPDVHRPTTRSPSVTSMRGWARTRFGEDARDLLPGRRAARRGRRGHANGRPRGRVRRRTRRPGRPGRRSAPALPRSGRDGARPGKAAAGAQRVLGVQLRTSRRIAPRPRRRPGRDSCRREQRALRDELDVGLRGGAQRSVEAGDAGADDDEIGGRVLVTVLIVFDS